MSSGDIERLEAEQGEIWREARSLSLGRRVQGQQATDKERKESRDYQDQKTKLHENVFRAE